MKNGIASLAAASAALLGNAAHAEKLDIDHRIYPPLHAAMEHDGENTVYYDASKPGRVFDRILIRGKSAASDWTEALELIVARRDAKLPTPQDWYRAFRPEGESNCPGAVTLLNRDETSLTFALDAPACPAGTPLTGLYRVVYGKKAVYVVGAKFKGAMEPTQREQLLTLLASAHVDG